MRVPLAVAILFGFTSLASAQIVANPAGALVAGSGTGRVDARNYAPGMRFPLRDLGWLNSQVYGVGGYLGPSGGQCDARNYSFPWVDNYCETRSYGMTLCPTGRGHQGQDIRPSTCANDTHPAVAAADGTVTRVGYVTAVVAADGTRYEYLHMSRHQVSIGQTVRCGDVLGYVSNLNAAGVAYTTYHLHFNIRQAYAGRGAEYMPPYGALLDAGRRLGTAAECSAAMPALDGGTGTDGGMPDAGGPGASCYSSTLGRSVGSGECVQVEAGACGAGECGVWQCVDGRWSCPVASCAETFAHPMCDSPEPPAGTCRSTTLGRDVVDGECVQVGAVARPGEAEMCSAGCGWYRCEAGSWQCVSEGACSAATNPNAECMAPMARSCRSSTLGRDVEDGVCVQVNGTPRPGEDASCSGGCGWYRCNDGAWNCVDESSCGADAVGNASCGATGADCASSTLGRDVSHGDRVQVDRTACGRESCGWYECSDGRWECTEGAGGSGMSYEHASCGAPSPGTGPTIREVAASLGSSCSTDGGDGLGRQLAETQMCLFPDAFVRFAPHPGITLRHPRVRPYAQATARDAIHAAAAVTPLEINSAFRPVSDQYLLFESCTGPAAAPGGSNHQSGRAIDVQNTVAARAALRGASCAWFGATDAVHYDCPGADLRADAVLAFQRLWNINNPGDTIAEDGVYGPDTAQRLGDAPAAGFAQGGCELSECGDATECGDCHDIVGCGWCLSTGECTSDAEAGACERWAPEVSACIACDATDCESCAASGFCSWGPGTGCINDSIPSDVAMCGGEPIVNPSGC
ncbi:MAG: peptidoglycan DD-metalloendopeptidase family protein [Myxococcota bacterium]